MITYYHDFFGDARGKSLPISWSFIECRFCILMSDRDGATGRRGDGATGRRGDGATGRRGDGATGRRGN
ncbi:MAG: hypothetical protein F6K17_30915, partial [Okeania sp. SIO3C4]|nr:hypothetical protein [Okeania sp. SIO3C4]